MIDWRRHFPTFHRLAGWLPEAPARRAHRWHTSPWWCSERREAIQRSLLHLVRGSVQQRVAPAPLIEAFACEHVNWSRRRLLRLAKRMRGGATLADALEQTPGAVSERDALAVRFGVQSGVLPAMLAQRCEEPRHVRRSLEQRLSHIKIYAIVTGLIFAFITAFICMKIFPSMREIYDDFELTYPASGRAYLTAVDWIAQMGWFLVIALLTAAAMARWSRVGRRLNRSLWASLLPPLRQLHVADILDMFAVSTEAGRPLPGAVSTLARYHFDPALR
ncbi:MAG: type II secretion system F family protein, partial [Planctomycetales bacterium]|nr:type II secretion system F family protein [Planctomycetales bacterium]